MSKISVLYLTALYKILFNTRHFIFRAYYLNYREAVPQLLLFFGFIWTMQLRASGILSYVCGLHSGQVICGFIIITCAIVGNCYYWTPDSCFLIFFYGNCKGEVGGWSLQICADWSVLGLSNFQAYIDLW